MANGEKRKCVELVDRKRREELLRRLGLIEDAESRGKEKRDRKSPKRRGGGGGDDYEDDYEDDHEPEEAYSADEDHDDKAKTGTAAATGKQQLTDTGRSVAVIDACPYSRWTFKDRKTGLRYLLSITKDAREEELLKGKFVALNSDALWCADGAPLSLPIGMLTKGNPPSAPQLWSNFDRRIQTRSVNRYCLMALYYPASFSLCCSANSIGSRAGMLRIATKRRMTTR